MKDNLIELEALLIKGGFTFKELDSRMNYGMIGHVLRGDNLTSLIFGGSFYMRNFDVAINTDFLRIVELIRIEFTELSRDNNGRISPVTLGIKKEA